MRAARHSRRGTVIRLNHHVKLNVASVGSTRSDARGAFKINVYGVANQTTYLLCTCTIPRYLPDLLYFLQFLLDDPQLRLKRKAKEKLFSVSGYWTLHLCKSVILIINLASSADPHLFVERCRSTYT